MPKSKQLEDNEQPAPGLNKLPPQGFSRFGKGPAGFFGSKNVAGPKSQFKPPAPRITQSKGAGGK